MTITDVFTDILWERPKSGSDSTFNQEQCTEVIIITHSIRSINDAFLIEPTLGAGTDNRAESLFVPANGPRSGGAVDSTEAAQL